MLQKYAIVNRFIYKLKKNDTSRASGICVQANHAQVIVITLKKGSVRASNVPVAPQREKKGASAEVKTNCKLGVTHHSDDGYSRYVVLFCLRLCFNLNIF